MIKKLFFSITLLTYSLSCCAATAIQAKQQAAVAMPDSFSADVSAQILAQGGNAIDAAIAAQFVLAVTLPEAGNIGGGGFMLIYIDGEALFLDYRETAPLTAHRDMYLNDEKAVIQNLSLIGAKAPGVPGTVAGFWEAHQRFGKLPWRKLVEPAIKLAEQGFIPAKILVDDIQGNYQRFNGLTNFQQYFGHVEHGKVFKPVSYTHLTLPTNREV